MEGSHSHASAILNALQPSSAHDHPFADFFAPKMSSSNPDQRSWTTPRSFNFSADIPVTFDAAAVAAFVTSVCDLGVSIPIRESIPESQDQMKTVQEV